MKPDAVITGVTADEADEAAEPVSPFQTLKTPAVVFIYDPTVSVEEYDKFEEVIFKNEKVGLGMKAFRTIKMEVGNADTDALVGGHGKTVPRMLVIDPVKERIKVLETKKIKVSSLYGAMKSVAKTFYKENLDKTVKTHLKLLNERDKLANELKVLKDKEGRLNEEKNPGKKLEKVKKEKAELEKEWEELTVQERKLWKLTPKASHQAA